MWGFDTSDSQGHTCVSLLGRCIALGERHIWAIKGYLLDLYFVTFVTAACRSLGLQTLRVRTAILPPSLCSCGCYKSLAIQGNINREGGQGRRKSVKLLHCNKARRKRGYEILRSESSTGYWSLLGMGNNVSDSFNTLSKLQLWKVLIWETTFLLYLLTTPSWKCISNPAQLTDLS